MTVLLVDRALQVLHLRELEYDVVDVLYSLPNSIALPEAMVG